MWFHGFYEGLRELRAFSTAGYSPTAEMFRGDFAETGRIIYDPATFDPSSGIRQPFPRNIIPATRINRVAQNLLPYYLPGSSLASRPANIRGNPRTTLNDNQWGLRVDSALNASHQLFGQFFRQDTPTVRPGLYPLNGQLYQNGSNLAMLQEVWTVSPRAVNILRIGFLRNLATGGNEAQELGPILASIGIANTFDQRGITAINLQGYSSFGRANGEVGNHDNTWQIDEEFTYTTDAPVRIRGRPALSPWMAPEWKWDAHGSLSFQPAFTAQLTSNAQGQLVPMADTGDAFADFLLGVPANGTLLGFPVVQYRGTQFAPFFRTAGRFRECNPQLRISWFLDTPPESQGWARRLIHGFDTEYRPVEVRFPRADE